MTSIDEPKTNYRRQSDENEDDGWDDEYIPAEQEQQTQQPTAGTTTDDDSQGEVFLLDVYKTRQQYGYLSILFSLVQTIILAIMMFECGVAPLRINPMLGPYPDVLSYWGAKNSALILDEGEHWRLLTPMLLHAGVIHLVGNISVQLETGVFFEREWGSPTWLIIYLTSTVGASILSTIAMPGSLSVGSSGAVMGIFGAKISEIFCRCCEPNKTQDERVGHAMRKHQLELSLGGCIIVMLFSFIPYVDWAAHLGGMLTGMAVGLPIFSCYIQSMPWRILWFVVGMGITIGGFTVSLQYMYTQVEAVEQLADVCGYYEQFFEDYECTCTLDGGD
jgi:membrane associated rhomboid family serine protease